MTFDEAVEEMYGDYPPVVIASYDARALLQALDINDDSIVDFGKYTIGQIEQIYNEVKDGRERT